LMSGRLVIWAISLADSAVVVILPSHDRDFYVGSRRD
jgi:hypothetical protein